MNVVYTLGRSPSGITIVHALPLIHALLLIFYYYYFEPLIHPREKKLRANQVASDQTRIGSCLTLDNICYCLPSYYSL